MEGEEVYGNREIISRLLVQGSMRRQANEGKQSDYTNNRLIVNFDRIENRLE